MTRERVKNLCGKRVDKDNAYEVWSSLDGSWKWYVLKKYQADDDKEFARWMCFVESPFTPNGETGDTYVQDVKSNAIRIK